jgi:hypothetical protein
VGEVVVRESVDFEGQVQVFLGGVEDGLAAGDAGVVDEDGGVAERGADGGGGGGDGGGGGEVALEEADGGWCCGLSVQSLVCLVCLGHVYPRR